MTANPLRETELCFDGKTYRFRPTFGVLLGIEAATAQPIRDLALKISSGSAALIEIVTVLRVMLRDKGQDWAIDDIGEVLVNSGFLSITGPLGKFLVEAQQDISALGAAPTTGSRRTVS